MVFMRCCGLFPGPAELGAVNPDAVHDHGQPAGQRTIAFFIPRRLAICIAQTSRQDHSRAHALLLLMLEAVTRTSFHHQPEAQHPKSSAINKPPADYPIYSGAQRTWQDALLGSRSASPRPHRRTDATIMLWCVGSIPTSRDVCQIPRARADLPASAAGSADSRGCEDRQGARRKRRRQRRSCREEAAVHRAVSNGDHPFRVGRGVIGALQCLAHVFGDGPSHQQHVGMAGRRDEAQAEAFEVVETLFSA